MRSLCFGSTKFTPVLFRGNLAESEKDEIASSGWLRQPSSQ